MSNLAVIHVKRNEYYMAVKEAIKEAITYFKKNDKALFVRVKITYGNKLLDEVIQKSEVIFRREVINQYYGIKFSQYVEVVNNVLAPKTASEVQELWRLIIDSQPFVRKRKIGILKRVKKWLLQEVEIKL